MEKSNFISELRIRCVGVTDEQYSLLEKFMKHVLLTNEKFNLTAIKDEGEFLEKMIFDSAILLNDVDLKNSSILDMGTGAGFPSVVLAILSNNYITALDSTKKKIDFIDEFCKTNGIKMDCVNARAEDFSSKNREKFDYVTARAMAPLRILVELGVPALKVGGKLLAYKGPNFEEEIEHCRGTLVKLGCHVEKVYDDILPESKEERAIIYIVKDKVTEKKYPREYKIIKEKSL
ncbi:MAG: 16S rRNA (guanine(527)-N(7))-methyltransferase RsmG [Bacilli bacterium]|nr:16S rRNA (guanine(527)-N(7))-methyltransferase RsmG [Bacilli bacterium]